MLLGFLSGCSRHPHNANWRIGSFRFSEFRLTIVAFLHLLLAFYLKASTSEVLPGSAEDIVNAL